jgi:hypothetical protein
MRTDIPVLRALARRYERSVAGRTGETRRDLLVDVEELLRDAGAGEGDARAVAETVLREAEAAGILILVPLHKRDPRSMFQVRFSPANEAKLFAALDCQAPAVVREALAHQFAEASGLEVPERWRAGWQAWCERMRLSALAGRSVEPFERQPGVENARLLALLPRLLAWEGESLVRFASCVLCGDSKTLELLAAKEREGVFRDKLRGKVGRLMEAITSGEIQTLEDLKIIPNPRFALVHGPLRLRFDQEWLDLGLLHGAFRLAEEDIARALEITTSAVRCLTVENETSFHELAKLHSGELLIHTSYPGSGTLRLLERLPDSMEFWHFGDSDAAGFDILRILREESKRDFRPLHMTPGREPFEQESLGRPSLARWPFYG